MGRTEILPVRVYLFDVSIATERPKSSGRFCLVEVHGVLFTQARKVLMPSVLTEQSGMHRQDIFQSNIRSCGHRTFEAGTSGTGHTSLRRVGARGFFGTDRLFAHGFLVLLLKYIGTQSLPRTTFTVNP